MIALHCDELSTTKHGWVQYGAVIFPAVVQQWCQLFSEDDRLQAMWQLATEVIEATGGRKHWVGHIGSGMQLTWEVGGHLSKRVITIPTPAGPVNVQLVVERARPV
jgi:hypothetical protein